eukprot:6087820-Prymnesium_polylepis.1
MRPPVGLRCRRAAVSRRCGAAVLWGCEAAGRFVQTVRGPLLFQRGAAKQPYSEYNNGCKGAATQQMEGNGEWPSVKASRVCVRGACLGQKPGEPKELCRRRPPFGASREHRIDNVPCLLGDGPKVFLRVRVVAHRRCWRWLAGWSRQKSASCGERRRVAVMAPN